MLATAPSQISFYHPSHPNSTIMKNSILILASISLFVACQSKTSTHTVEEKKPVETTQKKVADPSPRPYFKGSGNEPGWLIEIQTAPDGSYPVVLVHNYGMDTLTGTFNKIATPEGGKALPPNTESFVGNLQLRGKAVAVETLLTKEKCADDMSGKEASAKVEIKLERRSHRGCGKYLN